MVGRIMVRSAMFSAALSALLVPMFPAASDARADVASGRRSEPASSQAAATSSSPYLVSAVTERSCRASMKSKAAASTNGSDARWACLSDDRTAFLTLSATSDAAAASAFSEPEWRDVRTVELATLASPQTRRAEKEDVER